MAKRWNRAAGMWRSVSQLEQYERCPEQYRLRRVEKITPRPAGWSIQGTIFHIVCEAFERSDRRMSVDDAVDLFSTKYAAMVNQSLQEEPDLNRWMTAGPDGGSDIEARYILGREQIAAYVHWAKDKGPRLWKGEDGRTGIELHLTAEIGGVMVQGYIDQLVTEPDGSVRIRDLKTGSTKSKVQLETYAVLVRKGLGLAVNHGDWYMAKKGGLSRPVDLRTVSEAVLGARYAEMDDAVKQGLFPTRPGFHCRFCDVSHGCSFRR